MQRVDPLQRIKVLVCLATAISLSLLYPPAFSQVSVLAESENREHLRSVQVNDDPDPSTNPILAGLEEALRSSPSGVAQPVEAPRRPFSTLWAARGQVPTAGLSLPEVIFSQNATAGMEETDEARIKRKLASLNEHELPQFRYQPLPPGRSSSFIYETHGPVVFAMEVEGQIQNFRIRRKRSTGEFIVGPVSPVLDDPSIHPHLVVFQDALGFGAGVALPIGKPTRLGNREILVEAVASKWNKIAVTDLGSAHGTSILADIGAGKPEDVDYKISREDWEKAETILKTLSDSIRDRDKPGYDRESYARQLLNSVRTWTSLDPNLQVRLLGHLLVTRGWAEGGVVQSIEWLRRFFRIYHHVFYMTPDAAVSQGQRGLILFGRVRRYIPVEWRGFRTITQVEPIVTNMKGGFKPGTNEDEVLVLLDDSGVDPALIGLHESQHMFDTLEFIQYGMKSVGVRVGRETAADVQKALALLAIQGWELEFTAYARTMVQIGEMIEAEPAATRRQRASRLLDEVFGGTKYLDHYLSFENNSEEHIRATREFLDRFIPLALRLRGYPPGHAPLTEEDVKRANGASLKAYLDGVKNSVSGKLISEAAQMVLNDFYMEKLGYLPQYPDVASLTPVEITSPEPVQPTPAFPSPITLRPGQQVQLGHLGSGLPGQFQFVYAGPVTIQVGSASLLLRESRSSQGTLTLQQGSNALRLEGGRVAIPGALELSYVYQGGKYTVNIRHIGSSGVISLQQAAGMEEGVILRLVNKEGVLFDVYGADGYGAVHKALKTYEPKEAMNRGPISQALESAKQGLAVAQERLGGMVWPTLAFENVLLETEEGVRSAAYDLVQRPIPREWFLDQIVRERVRRATPAAMEDLDRILDGLRAFQSELHDRGVVHLDTHLSNYIQDDQDRIWVADPRLLTASPTRWDIHTHQTTGFSTSFGGILETEGKQRLFSGRRVTDEVFGGYDALTALADRLEEHRDRTADSIQPVSADRVKPMFTDTTEKAELEAEARKVFSEPQPFTKGPPDNAGLEEGVSVQTVGDLEASQDENARQLALDARAAGYSHVVLIPDALAAEANFEELVVTLFAQESVVTKAMTVLTPEEGLTLRVYPRYVPPQAGGVAEFLRGHITQEIQIPVIALDGALENVVGQILPSNHPLTLLLDSEEHHLMPYRKAIATLFTNPPKEGLRNLILKLSRGSVRTVTIGGRDYTAIFA